MYKAIAVAVLQISGAISITAGVGIISPAFGAIVGGILAITFGLALERGHAK